MILGHDQVLLYIVLGLIFSSDFGNVMYLAGCTRPLTPSLAYFILRSQRVMHLCLPLFPKSLIPVRQIMMLQLLTFAYA